MIWTQHDSTGRILWYHHGPAETLSPDHAAVEGHHDGATHWVDPETGQVEPRPAINLPPDQAFVGTDWTIPAAPAGTEVWLDGQHLGTTETDDEIVATFPLPGLWRVELRPPFPWREAGCSVEVSHAD